MFNHQSQLAHVEASFSSSYLPILTAERYALLSGSAIGVVEAQMDRRLLPVFVIGKRRFVNIEALRQRAIAEALQTPSRAGGVI
jgi:hypothetical protein